MTKAIERAAIIKEGQIRPKLNLMAYRWNVTVCKKKTDTEHHPSTVQHGDGSIMLWEQGSAQ